MRRKLLTVFLGMMALVCMSGCHGLEKTSTIKVSLLSANVRGEYIYGHEGLDPAISNSWGSSEYSFHVYVEQNGNITSAGQVATLEKSIAEENQKSFVTIMFDVPKGIDTESPFRVIAFDEDARVSLSKNTLTCKVPLERLVSHQPCWYVSEGKSGRVSSAQGVIIASSECLWFSNATKKAVKVKHKGWEMSNKWYYSDAEVQFSAREDIVVTPVGKSTQSEVVSAKQSVGAGEASFMQSRFVPTSKQIKDAVLVMEIDGKTVKTKPLSSDVIPQNGKPYYCSVKWNGTSLEWN